MKIEQKKGWAPVVITLDTMDEAESVYQALAALEPGVGRDLFCEIGRILREHQ